MATSVASVWSVRDRSASPITRSQLISLECKGDTCYVSQCDPPLADKRTAAVWDDRMPRGFPNDLAKVSRRKLRMLAATTGLDDLRKPPGNRLEALVDDREGQHSIRINDQWRLCFVWRDGDAFDVEIVDYHRG
jgi:toxin HigB-1